MFNTLTFTVKFCLCSPKYSLTRGAQVFTYDCRTAQNAPFKMDHLISYQHKQERFIFVCTPCADIFRPMVQYSSCSWTPLLGVQCVHLAWERPRLLFQHFPSLKVLILAKKSKLIHYPTAMWTVWNIRAKNKTSPFHTELITHQRISFPRCMPFSLFVFPGALRWRVHPVCLKGP